MRYSEEMRLIFKGYSKEEIARLKEDEKEELKTPPAEPTPEEPNPTPEPAAPSPDEEVIKKLEDYEKQIEALTAANKKLEEDIVALNNKQTLGEPVKQKDAADVMSELFKFKKKEEK